MTTRSTVSNAGAKFFAVLGVAVFEWINGNALAHAYLLLDAMQEQFRWIYGQAERFHPAFYEQFVLASYATRPAMVLMTHSAALVVVLLAFVSRRFIQSRTPPRNSADVLMRGHDPGSR